MLDLLNRLTDRIEKGPDGDEKIIRYGMWGTTSEIEKRKRQYFVVHPNKKEVKFNRLTEAAIYLREYKDKQRS